MQHCLGVEVCRSSGVLQVVFIDFVDASVKPLGLCDSNFDALLFPGVAVVENFTDSSFLFHASVQIAFLFDELEQFSSGRIRVCPEVFFVVDETVIDAFHSPFESLVARFSIKNSMFEYGDVACFFD